MIDCAQIVPVKVKYFQIVSNETKNAEKNSFQKGYPGSARYPFLFLESKMFKCNDSALYCIERRSVH